MVCEVPSDGASIDLSDMNVQEGDQLTITPCRGKLADVHNNGDEIICDTASTHFFNFQWSLSADNASLDMTSAQTTFSSSDGAWRADTPVSDNACPLQNVMVNVKKNRQVKTRCGIGADHLPNYGLTLFRGKYCDWKSQKDSPKVKVFPTQSEDNSFYMAEWYRKDGNSYRCLYREASKVTEVTTVYAGGTDTKAKADLMVIRRIYLRKKGAVGNVNTFQTADSDCELLNAQGEAVCPQNGKDDFRIFSGGTGTTMEGNTFIERRKLTNRDTNAVLTESLIDGADAGVDLSDETRQILRVDVGQVASKDDLGDNLLSHSTEKGMEGLPVHALVVKNTDCDKESVTDARMPEFHVGLGLPKGADPMTVEAHLYRYNASAAKWEKVNTPEDGGDWINGENGANLSAGLNPSWTYDLHAHLKDNEAIVVMPPNNRYEISYSVNITNYADFDVIKDKTRYPAETFHPNKHYFYGLFKNEDVKAQKGSVLIEVGTAHKNADAADGRGSATALTDVRPLKVNLFDYDFGKKEDFILSRQKQQFHFSYDPRNVPDTDVNTWHDREFTGIVGKNLSDDGQPVFRYSTPFEPAGVSLFDTKEVSDATNGGTKKVYSDVDFDFIYNKDDKSYSYTSGTNAACFDVGTNHMTQYSAPIGLDGWDEKSAGFFPFNSFQQDGHWGTKLKGNQGVYLLNGDKTIDYHFGMSMTHDFYIPENRKSESGKDLIFKLSADDDAWLFVDGKLAMDLGGIHEACDGVMNFTKGTIQVGSTMSPWNTSGSYQAPKTRSAALDSALMEPGKHTFSIFYLERGSTLSDLTINFNLPLEKKTEIVNTGGRGIGLLGLAGALTVLVGCAFISRERGR